MRKIPSLCIALSMACSLGTATADTEPAAQGAAPRGKAVRPERLPVVARPRLDLTGHTRVGQASFYAQSFAGRKMADGTRMDPHGANAASRTLPLGTTAKVTNVETGQSAVVTIQDRGPYVKGRIVDLSPATARAVGITPQRGVATVEVAPIAVPQPDGQLMLGDAARRVPDERQARRERDAHGADDDS
jgi:rare lipoprotein A